MLVDDANPRSIAFQSLRLKEHVAELPSATASAAARPMRLVTRCLFAVELADLDEPVAAVEDGFRESSDLLDPASKTICRACRTR
ncbi:MAG: alpha-E domain-containing protein [Bryobacterales bacterium]